jgi:predicted amidohydrolase YtcJ
MGAAADLVILDGDPFVAAEVSALVVEETIVSGETVYRR